MTNFESAAVNAQTGFPSTPATPPWSNEFKGLLMSVLKVRWSAIIMITLESRSGTVTCDETRTAACQRLSLGLGGVDGHCGTSEDDGRGDSDLIKSRYRA